MPQRPTNLLAWLLAPVWSIALLSVAGAAPNIVLVVVDDLGWRDLGCYGSTFYETPNIDRLASEGMRFTDAYAACPVCSPSRAALMTGKNPTRLGLTAHIGDVGPERWSRSTPLLPAKSLDHLPHREHTLAEALHDAGYATMHAGKWHLGHEPFWPEYHGFDVNVGGWSQGGPFGGNQYFSPYGNPRLHDGPRGEHLPDRLADEVCRFVQAHRHEPFFVNLAWYSVHVPLVAKEDLVAKYRRKAEERAPDEMHATRDGVERVRQDHAVYAAMVESVDTAFGKVLAALEEAEVAENTVILFTSDNGGLATGDIGISEEQGWPTTNAPLRAGKGWLYEGGIRVPLIARAPGLVTPGSESSRVVNGHDLFATVLDLVGLSEGDRPSDSISFADALKGSGPERPATFWHYPHYGNQGGRPGAAMREGGWKLIEWYAPPPHDPLVELYHLTDDPSEEVDLANSRPDVRDRLLSKLHAWRQDAGAVMPSRPSQVAARPR